MANNYNLRQVSENNGLIEDFPYREIKGLVNFTDSIQGLGFQKILSLYRYVSLMQVIPVSTTTYLDMNGGTASVNHWWRDLPLGGPSPIDSQWTAAESGVYIIHYMVSYLTGIGANSGYYVELIYYPGGNLAIPGTVSSTANMTRTSTSFSAVANSKTFMRYMTAGDSWRFRVWNSEANSAQLAMNVLFFPLA